MTPDREAELLAKIDQLYKVNAELLQGINTLTQIAKYEKAMREQEKPPETKHEIDVALLVDSFNEETVTIFNRSWEEIQRMQRG